MNWKKIVKAAFAAAIGGAATSVTALHLSPETFPKTREGLLNLLSTVAIGAAIGLGGLLTRFDDGDESDAPKTSSVTSTQKLGAVALCFLVMSFSMTGCTAQQVQNAAKQIAAYIPTVESVLASVDGVAGLFLPADQALLATGVKLIDTNLTAMQTDITTCLSTPACVQSPTSSGWQQIASLIDEAVSNIDAQTLAAAKITDPASQAKAQAALSLVSVGIHLIDSWIQATLPAQQVQATAAARKAKLKTVSVLWTPEAVHALDQQLEATNGISYAQWSNAEYSHGF